MSEQINCNPAVLACNHSQISLNRIVGGGLFSSLALELIGVKRLSLHLETWQFYGTILLQATCVCVNNQSLTQLSSISKLPNLRWASFANNLLHKTEVGGAPYPFQNCVTVSLVKGLEQCIHLEELILNDNLVKKVEGLDSVCVCVCHYWCAPIGLYGINIYYTGFHNLKKLHHLAIASNLITSIADCGLNSMPHLQFLDVSDNLISSMEGLRHCNSLQLLYASNNKISDCRELLSLKVYT